MARINDGRVWQREKFIQRRGFSLREGMGQIIPPHAKLEQGISREKRAFLFEIKADGSFRVERGRDCFEMERTDLGLVPIFQKIGIKVLSQNKRFGKIEGSVLLGVIEANEILFRHKKRNLLQIHEILKTIEMVEMAMGQDNTEKLSPVMFLDVPAQHAVLVVSRIDEETGIPFFPKNVSIREDGVVIELANLHADSKK